jgi:hypothetical protein
MAVPIAIGIIGGVLFFVTFFCTSKRKYRNKLKVLQKDHNQIAKISARQLMSLVYYSRQNTIIHYNSLSFASTYFAAR